MKKNQMMTTQDDTFQNIKKPRHDAGIAPNEGASDRSLMD